MAIHRGYSSRFAAGSVPHYRLQRNEDNRGLRPQDFFVPFFRKKVPKNSPADASAYFVPANVRNGRLFAGLQANRPRFLPLLAGTSFRGSGIGPESFAAKRGGKDASGTNRKHRSLRSPLEAVLNRRIIVRSGKKEHSPARVPGAGGWQRRPQARADSVLFAEPPQPKRRVFLRRKVLFLLRPLNVGRRLFPRKRHADGFGAFNFATLVFLLLARHSPQAVSARAACVG